MRLRHFAGLVLGCTVYLSTSGILLRADSGSFYNETDLVSDIKGANRIDPNLVNAWGIDASPTGPWWVNANGTGLSIVYDANGNPAPANSPIVVTVPPPGAGGTSTPTGIVFNTFNGSNDFLIAPGEPALFIFATEDGTISAWNPVANATRAIIKVPANGGIYKGLTLGQVGSRKLLYAANFHTGNIDVFDTNFAPVPLSSLSANAFRDASIPAGFAPFNVWNVNGSIFVMYAKQDSDKEDDVAAPGNGYVDQYNTDGTPVRRLEHGPWLSSPWGIAMAPGDFGDLSGRLLVGNFGSGQIASFNAQTGAFEGLMLSHGNHPVTIDGLWGLKFGNGAQAGPANVLFFAAGIDDEAHGLFGTLRAKHEDDDTGDDQGGNNANGNGNGNGNSNGKSHGRGRH